MNVTSAISLAPRVKVLVIVAASLLSLNSQGQSISDLAGEVAELASKYAEFSQFTDGTAYLLAKYGLGSVGKDIALDKAKKSIASLNSDGAAQSVLGRLKGSYADSQFAKGMVEGVNANMTDTPDYSHLDYCAQVQASSAKLARVEATVASLQKLVGLAGNYKNALVPLSKMSSALGTLYGEYVGMDLPREETTEGTLAQQWHFYTDNADAGSDGDQNAGFLVTKSRVNWDFVQTQAKSKAQKLSETLVTLKAFHEHFYAEAEHKCSDDRAKAAALATLGGMFGFEMPVQQGPGKPSPADACQSTGPRAASFLSGCLQSHPSMCATFTTAARCYSMAGSQCGACGPCSTQMQSAAAQARASAQQVCAQ